MIAIGVFFYHFQELCEFSCCLLPCNWKKLHTFATDYRSMYSLSRQDVFLHGIGRGHSTPCMVWGSRFTTRLYQKRALGGENDSPRHIEGVYLTRCLRRTGNLANFKFDLDVATVDAPGCDNLTPVGN